MVNFFLISALAMFVFGVPHKGDFLFQTLTLTATGVPESLHKAPIAIVDEDRSPLSERIVNAFYPPNFQRDVLAGRQPAVQLNVDATRMSQAFIGNSYIQTIVNGEAAAFVQGHRTVGLFCAGLGMDRNVFPGCHCHGACNQTSDPRNQ